MQPVTLLILITTHASDFERRDITRTTWGKDPKKDHPTWKTYFLIVRTYQIGAMRNLYEEKEVHNDLVIANVKENFYNLIYKVQSGFEWSVKYCNYKFLLKGDDDAFLESPETP